jgi:hypothetical protein
LIGIFRSTKKNAVSANFLASQGFQRVENGSNEDELYRSGSMITDKLKKLVACELQLPGTGKA